MKSQRGFVVIFGGAAVWLVAVAMGGAAIVGADQPKEINTTVAIQNDDQSPLLLSAAPESSEYWVSPNFQNSPDP